MAMQRPPPPQDLAAGDALRFYLILHDISKRSNVGTILRTASAFGAAAVLVVGGQRRSLRTFGAHGADKRLRYYFFDSLKQAVDFARHDLRCAHVIGVEIRPDAVSVSAPDAFRGSSAVIMGNEGTGLAPPHAALCDRFVYIPQFGNGTASLNVGVAAGVVFHCFATFAGAPERARTGEKYDVDAVVFDGTLQPAELRLRGQRQEGVATDALDLDFALFSDMAAASEEAEAWPFV
jgi:tRNA G18 (ribose-2'-O)-methylase SpoU